MRQSMTIREFSFTLVLFALFALATIQTIWCQSAPTSPATPQGNEPTSPSGQPTGSVLVIGGGDLLKVSVFGAPESDQEVRVDQDGNISLNFIGSVHVAGLTTNGAQDLIAKKLVVYFENMPTPNAAPTASHHAPFWLSFNLARK